jgi:hypothetical protein
MAKRPIGMVCIRVGADVVGVRKRKHFEHRHGREREASASARQAVASSSNFNSVVLSMLQD